MPQFITLTISTTFAKSKENIWKGQVCFVPEFKTSRGDVVSRVEVECVSVELCLENMMGQPTVRECLELMKKEAEERNA